MAQKKMYAGGFKLTKKTAAALAVQELGTARGLEQEPNMPDGYYTMRFGHLEVRIQPDTYNTSGRILLTVWMNGTADGIVQFFDRETLEQDFNEEGIYWKKRRREALEDWVDTNGPDFCRDKVDQIAGRAERGA